MSGLSLQGLPYDITRLMTETVRISQRTGEYTGTGHATPVYGTEETVPCRISHLTRMVRSNSGEVKVSSAQIWINTEILTVTPDDKVFIGTDTTPTPILRVDVGNGEYGQYLQKIYT